MVLCIEKNEIKDKSGKIIGYKDNEYFYPNGIPIKLKFISRYISEGL